MPEPVTAEVHIAADRETVYEYFTGPESMVRWMGEYAHLDPEPGGTFAVDIQGTHVGHGDARVHASTPRRRAR